MPRSLANLRSEWQRTSRPTPFGTAERAERSGVHQKRRPSGLRQTGRRRAAHDRGRRPGQSFLAPELGLPEDVIPAFLDNRALDKFIGEGEPSSGRFYYRDLESLGSAIDKFEKYSGWRATVHESATQIKAAIDAI